MATGLALVVVRGRVAAAAGLVTLLALVALGAIRGDPQPVADTPVLDARTILAQSAGNPFAWALAAVWALVWWRPAAGPER